jgi:CelD/BcsL family acetyltransferase involved in cellulose biosynthesis
MADAEVRFLAPGEEDRGDVVEFYKNSVHSVFQEIEFNRIVTEVFSTQLRFLTAQLAGELIGVCPVHIVRDNWIRATIHASPRMYEVPYGGWVLKDRGLELELARLLPVTFNQSLLYWSLPVLDGNEWPRSRDVTRFGTLVIDLGQSSDEIFERSIDSKRRNMIRKAERSGVRVVEGSVADVDVFYDRLVRPTNAKAGISLHPKNYYTNLLRQFGGTGMLKLFLAEYNGETLAAILLVLNRWFAHYWIGAKADDVQNLGQGELLQWHAIQFAKQKGSKYYDLCGYEPRRLPRIAEFKADFSKHVVPFYLYAKRSVGYRIAYRIFR